MSTNADIEDKANAPGLVASVSIDTGGAPFDENLSHIRTFEGGNIDTIVVDINTVLLPTSTERGTNVVDFNQFISLANAWINLTFVEIDTGVPEVRIDEGTTTVDSSDAAITVIKQKQPHETINVQGSPNLLSIIPELEATQTSRSEIVDTSFSISYHFTQCFHRSNADAFYSTLNDFTNVNADGRN